MRRNLLITAHRALKPLYWAEEIGTTSSLSTSCLLRNLAEPAHTVPFSLSPGHNATLHGLRNVYSAGPSCYAAQPQSLSDEDSKRPIEEDHATNPLEGKKVDGDSPNDAKLQELGYLMTYPKYDTAYVESIKPKHKPAEELYQKTALWAVSAMRWGFDTITGYPKKMDECKWLRRIVFLETVAGVPGMVGGMLRHMKSLRTMSRDHGWIHTLLEEAENERMHLLTFMQLKQPGPFFRGFVLLTQGIFFNLYTMFYLISPKHCHAFVGYLEEEAVRTYSHALEEMDAGKLPDWEHQRPPEIGMSYWGLREGATMRDLLLAVRADEHGHSHVNHTFSVLQQSDDNPFEKGSHEVP